ncbi:Molybdopterin molybdenumtransferase [hydrothermal vent metagenome]|uniref:Molybdopterin molybdenumtransferase n=1 Tax=hydrothermal vent metagenome TaxID=652676 RepID=A0A3B0TBN9_9ZZZZ
MINSTDADQIIEEALPSLKLSEIFLKDAYGAILQEDIYTDRDYPSFNKSLMDGVAISLDSYEKGQREFLVQGVQAAGYPSLKLDGTAPAVEIMTGAVIPDGCDCVIPIEEIKIADQKFQLADGLSLSKHQHSRLQGDDQSKGELLLKKGCQLGPFQISIAATVGKQKIQVSQKLKIAIISTGDEIVDLDKEIEYFQTRKSNSYFIESALGKQIFCESQIFHYCDNEKEIREGLSDCLERFDVLILSGGVSMGKFDYVPKILKDLEVEVLFHKIKQRPGKPFWFGKSKKEKLVFALPGNPVSTQSCLYRYVLPALKKYLGIKLVDHYARLMRGVKPLKEFTRFVAVKLDSNLEGVLEATPCFENNSGDLLSIAHCDGFMEIPPGDTELEEGYVGKVFK